MNRKVVAAAVLSPFGVIPASLSWSFLMNMQLILEGGKVLEVALRISLVAALLALPAAYFFVLTYGFVSYHYLRKYNRVKAGYFVALGALPGLLIAAFASTYLHISPVPQLNFCYFGIWVSLCFWYCVKKNEEMLPATP